MLQADAKVKHKGGYKKILIFIFVISVCQFIYIFNYRFKYILETIFLMPKRQKMAIQKL